MKKEFKRFIRAFNMTFTVLFCILLLISGIFKSYENIRATGFGEYKKAIEINDGRVRILDFEFSLYRSI